MSCHTSRSFLSIWFLTIATYSYLLSSLLLPILFYYLDILVILLYLSFLFPLLTRILILVVLNHMLSVNRVVFRSVAFPGLLFYPVFLFVFLFFLFSSFFSFSFLFLFFLFFFCFLPLIPFLSLYLLIYALLLLVPCLEWHRIQYLPGYIHAAISLSFCAIQFLQLNPPTRAPIPVQLPPLVSYAARTRPYFCFSHTQLAQTYLLSDTLLSCSVLLGVLGVAGA